MVDMPIYNETDYVLTEAMTQHIIRDAQEHFGEEVRSVRVQSGIERHAFNVRTREVRYAFSPQDFGLVHTMPIVPETPRSRRRRPRRDDETAEEILPTPFEDVEVEAEDLEPLETSLESLDEGQDEDEDEDDVFKLDNQDDDEEDEDESFFDHDAYDA
ncbi:MAG TPA: hypothetical protein VLQ80_30970 [Candidatus Saccharimonadia bacterium]|nr:hypothetical protein [Candidatus Saccharimonadia bacterium]